MLARYGGGAQADYSTTESEIRDWLAAAGLEASIERVVVEADLPPVLDYVSEHLKALPWSAGFFGWPAEMQAEGLAELDAELADFRTGDGLRVPFCTYLLWRRSDAQFRLAALMARMGSLAVRISGGRGVRGSLGGRRRLASDGRRI